MPQQWFVARHQPGLARTAETHLRRQYFSPYLPVVPHPDRPSQATIALFPGYIFIPLDLEDETVRWQAINSTRGIIKLLPHHLREPLPLPNGFIEDIQGAISNGAFTPQDADALIRKYTKDEAVPVISGPFAGHTGTMIRYTKGSLEILLSLLGREIKVTVPNHQVARPRPEVASVPVR